VNGLRTHWTLRRWLSAYIDGELTGDLLQRVREHVVRCQACERDLEDIRRGRNLLLHAEPLAATVSRASRPSAFRSFPALRWTSIAALALAIITASVWWRLPSVHAMDIDFYAAQFRMSDRCAYPCTSLREASVAELRQTSPFPVQYPGWLPEGMVLRRVVRYRTPLAEGIGLIFADHGKEFCIFQQPRKLTVVAPGRRPNATRICGRKCNRTDGDRVQFFNWTNGRLCFVVATNIPKDEVEAVVDSLGELPK
jgi:hypothetical protein